jgi:hypothetical protein
MRWRGDPPTPDAERLGYRDGRSRIHASSRADGQLSFRRDIRGDN